MTFRNYYETRVHFWRMSPLCRIVVHIFLVSLTFSCHRDGFLKCLSNLDIEKYGEANNFRYNFQILNAHFFQECPLHIWDSDTSSISDPHIFVAQKEFLKNVWHLTTEFHWSETMKNNPHYIHAYLMKSFLKERCTYFLHYSGDK